MATIKKITLRGVNFYLCLLCIFKVTLFSLAVKVYAEEDPELKYWDVDINEISSGEREFIATPPDTETPQLENSYTITKQTLETGWLEMEQCHKNLDDITSAEVTYQFREMKDLTVISSSNIEKVEVKDQSIQLTNVEKNASLCASAKVRLLERQGETYTLSSGPYMRRFLDGYYPQRVVLTIHYPQELNLTHYAPEQQEGLTVNKEAGKLTVDAHFQGKLYFNVIFESY